MHFYTWHSLICLRTLPAPVLVFTALNKSSEDVPVFTALKSSEDVPVFTALKVFYDRVGQP
ncbi:hypothetical protein AAC387_Pa05g0342 [Persea americana]